MIGAWQQTAWDYYKQHGRHDLPWRMPASNKQYDPYVILVSEMMLQQTQVGRVIPKFKLFLTQFPTVQSLADAPLATVLIAWSGLGYNRRAKFLWQAARQIVHEQDGAFPQTIETLVALPGVGANTAGAIVTYAFNRPVVYVETNIRTVLIHHLFADHRDVKDKDLLPYLHEAVDAIVADGRNPREWYWALMDYGTFLKQTVGNLSTQSAAYAKQSKFEGSRRQVRGHVLRLLADGPLNLAELMVHCDDERLEEVVDALVDEAIISQQGSHYHLGSP